MIVLSRLGNDVLWDIIQKYTLQYLINNVNTLGISTSVLCFSRDIYVLNEERNMMYGLEAELIQSGSRHNEYILDKTYKMSMDSEKIKVVGEMYIYLHMCPKFMLDWMKLYTNMIQKSSPDIIVQTLNRIMVTGRIKKDKTLEDIAKMVLNRAVEKLQLKFHTFEGLNKVILKNFTSSEQQKSEENAMEDDLKFLYDNQSSIIMSKG